MEHVRAIGLADLHLLDQPRASAAVPQIKKLRDRHHGLARCLASGMADGEASAVTGYDPSRISILKRDPQFKELVSHYQEVKESAFADFHERASTLATAVVAEIADRLEDDPDAISLGQLLEVGKFVADRSGNGPSTKVQQTNLNVDLGGRLQAAAGRMLSVPAPPPADELLAEFTVVGAVDANNG